jgi:hypothetical protein
MLGTVTPVTLGSTLVCGSVFKHRESAAVVAVLLPHPLTVVVLQVGGGGWLVCARMQPCRVVRVWLAFLPQYPIYAFNIYYSNQF